MAAVSLAKSASRIRLREADRFSLVTSRLEIVAAKRFCTAPRSARPLLTCDATLSGNINTSQTLTALDGDPVYCFSGSATIQAGTTITVPAGATVTVMFDNRDAGIPHNFSVYTDRNMTQSIFVGQIISGPATINYTFTAPTTPGTYFFVCDVHPATMTGDFVVTRP